MRANLGSTSTGPRRGVGSGGPEILPVAQAVVMGLGGSGIQTISRVKSMVESAFPESAATSSLEFLGIDAVDQKKQNPPLPLGVELDQGEFFNLTQDPFEPALLVESESRWNSPMQRWWDFSRQVPPGPVFDGLKQDRMLGRLAYYRAGDQLTDRITTGLRRSAQLTQRRVEDGQAGGEGGVRARVYLAASMCGGTGSSGLLEVIYRIWAAAGPNMTPEIKLFLFMPGVFEQSARSTSPNPVAQVANLRANAYGFLRELDHFIVHSDRLADNVASPGLGAAPQIPASGLVHQVFLIDSQLSTGEYLGTITDAYDVASYAIYQLLMTRVGREIAVNGVNMDELLRDVDGHGKRRIYCGLGMTCVTYPGETLRQHLSNRFAEWLVRERLLATSPDLSERVRRHPQTAELLGAISNLEGRAVTFERADRVRTYANHCLRAPEILADDSSDETVVRVIVNAKETRASALAELQVQLETHRHSATADLERVIIGTTLEMGESLPFLRQVLKHAAAQVEDSRSRHQKQADQAQQSVSRGEEEIEAALKTLNGTVGWRAWLGRRDNAAKDLGAAIAAFGRSSVDHYYAQSNARFFETAMTHLSRLHDNLQLAERKLIDESERFTDAWHSDELIGKDAGPQDLTALIPADVRPEVEDSALAKESFDRVRAAVDPLDRRELLRGLYRRWRGDRGGRAAFDLGSRSSDRSATSRTALLRELELLADEYALQVGMPEETPGGDNNLHRMYLPRSLEDAANMVDGGRSLDTALVSIGSLAGSVMLPVDSTKLRTAVTMAPSTIVSRPSSLANAMARHVDGRDGITVHEWQDRERVQALTTVWGASAHALSAVRSWRPAYDNALKPDARGLSKPPHLSRTWVAELTPLEPDYNDLQMAADCAVQALLASRLLTTPTIREAIFGTDALAAHRCVPLELAEAGLRTAWHGSTFRRQPDQRWGVSREFDFGTGLSGLLTEIGNNPLFRQDSANFAEAVVAVAGRATALDAMRGLAERIARLVDDYEGVPEDRHAADLLRKEARELIRDMERIAAARAL